MNHFVGKSTGIALLMAAALLASLFAMGVFSATGVGAHGDHGAGDDAHLAQLDLLSAEAGPVGATEPDGTGADPVTNILDPIIGELAGNGNITAVTDGENAAEDGYALTVPVGASYLSIAVNTAVDAKITGVMVNGEAENFTLYEGFAEVEALVPATAPPTPDGATVFDDADLSGDTATRAVQVDLTKGIVNKVEIVVSDEVPPSPDADRVAHDDQTYTINVSHDSPTNSTTAGAAIRLTLKADIRADVDDEIVIDLTSFNLPSSIDEDHITINGENPSDASISGSKLTLVFAGIDADTTDTDDTAEDPLGSGETTDIGPAEKVTATIRISNKAGIANPNKAGNYPIKISDDDYAGDTADVDAINVAKVIRTISIDPKKGGAGAEVTVTGKGYTDGRARVYIDDTPPGEGEMTAFDGENDTLIESATISDGSFSVATTKIKETSEINAYDLEEDVAAANAKFTLAQSISVSPSDLAKTDTLTITLKDWLNSVGEVTAVSFTGAGDVDVPGIGEEAAGDFVSYKSVEDEDNQYTLKVKVPTDADTGQVKVTVKVVSSAKGSANINIETLALTVTPSTAVPGQSISIRGSDFSDDAEIGDADADTPGHVKVAGIAITDLSESVDSNGNIDISVKVPETAKAGDTSVEVMDDDGRVGKADLTIPTPTLSIDPSESRIGTTVAVEGSGFPANDLVLIEYDGNAVESAATSLTGGFKKNITVPGTAKIGDEHNITAEPQVYDESVNEADAVKHSTPDPTISFNPAEAVPGSQITVSGENFRPFAGMDSVTIGNRELSIASVSVRDDGSFTTPSLTVPLVTPNNYLVTVVAKEPADGQANEYLNIVEAIEEVSTDPAVVFADLFASDRLSRVWYLDRAEQDWIFYDPRPEFVERGLNELTELPARPTVVTLIIKEGEILEFEGETLYPGTNPIPLN